MSLFEGVATVSALYGASRTAYFTASAAMRVAMGDTDGAKSDAAKAVGSLAVTLVMLVVLPKETAHDRRNR